MALPKEREVQISVDIRKPWMTDADLFEWEVWSFAPVIKAPAGFEEQVPYMVALLRGVKRLGDNKGAEVMVSAQLTDVIGEEIEIGMRVEPVVRKYRADGDRGVIDHHIKFRPLFVSNQGERHGESCSG